MQKMFCEMLYLVKNRNISFSHIKINAQFIYLCNPYKSLVNVCLMKILKNTVHRKIVFL